MKKNELPKIFIVDDEDINLKYLHRILSTSYDVSSTNNSAEALQLIKEINPDIILLDVYMPVLNGFDLCKKITEDKKTNKIPVIFISSPEHTKKGLGLGAVDFISKPINKEETIARIKTHLTISNLRKELEISNKELKKLVKEKSRSLAEEKMQNENISKALIESEKRFQSIFKEVPEAIIIVSVESGEIVDANYASCNLFEYNHDELVGMNQTRLFHPSEKTIKDNYLRIKSESGLPQNMRLSLNILITKSGKEIPVQISSKTLLIEGELYLFGVVFDLSSRMKTEQELVRAKEEAEKLERLKSSLLSNISHELRTPLVGMLGFSNMLEEELEDDALRHMAKSISISGKRLLNTLKVLLDFSTLESGEFIPDMVDVNLNSVIENVIESFVDSFKEKGLKVDVQLPKEELIVEAACAFITEVISQILNNAITFTHYGSIAVSLEAEKNFAVISIKDTGIGMSGEKLDSIFDEFQQLSEGFSREYDGLGLGLTLVKKIVEMHKGKIIVKSKEGEGSLFQVKLRLKK